MTITSGLSLNDVATESASSVQRFDSTLMAKILGEFAAGRIPAEITEAILRQVETVNRAFHEQHTVLKNLSLLECSVADVGNQPGWYLLETGDEQFPVEATNISPPSGVDGDPIAAESRLRFHYEKTRTSDVANADEALDVYLTYDADPVLRSSSLAQAPTLRFRFERLDSLAVHALGEELFRGGLDALLAHATQRTEEIPFAQTYAPASRVVPPRRFRGNRDVIDFEGPLGLYYEEIFLHAPFLIANRLNREQRFDEAQAWYHYVFDPTARHRARRDDRTERRAVRVPQTQVHPR